MTDRRLDPKRGEIWYVDFDPIIGSELNKTRPAVVLSVDAVGRTNMRIVVPITNWKPDFVMCHWIVRVEPTGKNGLKKVSGADEGVRSSV